MTEDDDTGPEGGRAVASRLVYDSSIATVDEATFNELVALMRDGRPTKPPTPETLWRRAYHKAMFSRRLVGVQPDLFGAKPITHMHRTKPGPASTWTAEPVEEKLARIARDPRATFGIGRPALSPEERSAAIDGAANWLRIAQRVRIAGSFASYDGDVAVGWGLSIPCQRSRQVRLWVVDPTSISRSLWSSCSSSSPPYSPSS